MAPLTAEECAEMGPCPDCLGGWEPAEHGALLLHAPSCPALHGFTSGRVPLGWVPFVEDGTGPDGRRLFTTGGEP